MGVLRLRVCKGTNESRPKIRVFFSVRNWMCGVSACENRKKRVSHAESVGVGSSVSVCGDGWFNLYSVTPV